MLGTDCRTALLVQHSSNFPQKLKKKNQSKCILIIIPAYCIEMMIWLDDGFKCRNLLLDCITLASPLKLTVGLKNNCNAIQYIDKIFILFANLIVFSKFNLSPSSTLYGQQLHVEEIRICIQQHQQLVILGAQHLILKAVE